MSLMTLGTEQVLVEKRPEGRFGPSDVSLHAAPARILVVEDDDATRLSLLRALSLEGYDSCGVSTAAAAHEALSVNEFQLVVLDVGFARR